MLQRPGENPAFLFLPFSPSRISGPGRVTFLLISGPISARGDLKVKGATGFTAQARLAIAPEPRGIPVSGRLDADYSGGSARKNLPDGSQGQEIFYQTLTRPISILPVISILR